MQHEHEQAPEGAEQTTNGEDERKALSSIARTLGDLLERHKKGEPVFAEMAARIHERAEGESRELVAEALRGLDD